MLIKKLAVGTALALSLATGACGDDDNKDDPTVGGDAGDAGGRSDGGVTAPGDGGVGMDAQVGMDGSLPDGGADSAIGDAGGSAGDGGGTLPDGALSNVDAAAIGNGASGNQADASNNATPDAGTDTTPDAGTDTSTTPDAGTDTSTTPDAGTTPETGECAVNSESFGCGRAVTSTWVRFDNGLEIDRASGLAWAPEVATETDHDLEQHCEALSFGQLDAFHIPEIAEVRTLANGCGKTETGGACAVESGEEFPSGAGDCECDEGLTGPYEGGRFCRPELPTCDTLWTSTYCGGAAGTECETHAHWFYDVSSGSIVRAGYETDLAKNAKGRCSATVPAELIP